MLAIKAIRDDDIRSLYRASAVNPNKPKGGSVRRIYATPEEIKNYLDMLEYLAWRCNMSGAVEEREFFRRTGKLIAKRTGVVSASSLRGEYLFGGRVPAKFKAIADAVMKSIEGGVALGEHPELKEVFAQLGA